MSTTENERAGSLVAPVEPRAYTDADHDAAYTHWLESGSIARTSAALGIPRGTLMSWSSRQNWGERRKQDESAAREIVVSRTLALLADSAASLAGELLQIAREGTRDDATRLSAIRAALAMVGVTESGPARGRPRDESARVIDAPVRATRPTEPQDTREIAARLETLVRQSRAS